MSLLLTISILLSVTFMLIKHPISMSIFVLLQTMVTSLLMGIMVMNFWFSYILFLTMIGGMLIIFLYMTNVASNEKFESSWIFKYPVYLLLMSLMLNPLLENFYLNNNFIIKNNNLELSLEKFYLWPFNLMMIILMIYLLFSLIMTVNMTSSSMGPLRKMK